MASMGNRLRPLLAAAALLAGVVALAATAMQAPRLLLSAWRPHLDRKLLREMAGPLREPAAARKLYEVAPPARGTAADFLRGERAAWAELVRGETVQPAGPGWSLREARVESTGLPMAEVAQLLERAEAQRPPWRAGRLSVEALDTNGNVRLELTLRRLERQEK